LDAVHERLDLVLRDLLAFVLRGLGLVGPVPLLRLGLLCEHGQVVVGRRPQLVHQLLDLFRRGAVPHGLGQPLLRPLEPFARVAERAVLEQHGEVPQGGGDLLLFLGGHGAAVGDPVEAADRVAQPQVDLAVGEELLGAVRHGPQDLRHAAGVGGGPQDVAPLLDEGAGHGLEEAPARQRHGGGFGRGLLPRGVAHGEGERHGEVGEGVLGQVLDELLLELRAVAAEGHGEVEDQGLARVGVHGEAVAAVHGRKVQRHGRGAGLDAVVVGGREGLGHLAHRVGLDGAGQPHGGGRVGQEGHVPLRAPRPLDGEPAGLDHLEDLLGRGGRGGLARAGRHRLLKRERAHLAVEADRDLGALGHLQGARGRSAR
jgi:hypothetical protein